MLEVAGDPVTAGLEVIVLVIALLRVPWPVEDERAQVPAQQPILGHGSGSESAPTAWSLCIGESGGGMQLKLDGIPWVRRRPCPSLRWS